jgi:hypothetical protein
LVAELVAGEVKWSERIAGIITGAITRSVRTPTIGSSVITRVSGRAGVAWIAAGVLAMVAGDAARARAVARFARVARRVGSAEMVE